MNSTLFAKGNNKTLNNLKDLRKQAHSDKEPRVALRIQGIMLSLENHSVSEIAELLKVHRSSVHSWIVAWNEHGRDGLLEGHRSGRPSELGKTEIVKLKDIIESGPVAYGLNTGVWTSPIIAYIIDEEFNVSYHPGHVRKLLKKIGFSVQRPTTQLILADPQQQNRWVRYIYPNLKKKRRQKVRQ